MVEPTPVTPFKMPETQLLFQFLIVAFNDPAMFGHLHQFLQLRCHRKCGEPVFSQLCFPLRPFDQQPLFSTGLRHFVIAMRRADPDGGEARLQLPFSTLTPGKLLRELAGGKLIASCFTDTG